MGAPWELSLPQLLMGSLSNSVVVLDRDGKRTERVDGRPTQRVASSAIPVYCMLYHLIIRAALQQLISSA